MALCFFKNRFEMKPYRKKTDPKVEPHTRLLEDAMPSALICHFDSATLVSKTFELCEEHNQLEHTFDTGIPIFWSGPLSKLESLHGPRVRSM